MSKNNSLKIGAIVSYVSIFLNIATGLFYIPWIKDRVGIEQYGLYLLSNSIISIFMVDFGLGSAVTRYLSKYHAEGDEKKASQFLGAVYKLYFSLDILLFVIFTIVYFCIDGIYVKLSPQELTLFKGTYIISVSFALINFPFMTHNGILNSYEKFVQLKLADVIYRVLVVVSTVITLSIGGGLYALVICNAASGLAIIFYKFLVIRKTVPIRADFGKTEKRIYKEISSFSLWVTLSSLAYRLIFNITPSILGSVANSVAIAIFGVVTTIESYSYLVINAIDGMFMPRVSRIYAKDKEDADIMPLMIKVGRFQFALNALIVVGFAVVGKDFVCAWMGKEFANAYIGVLLVITPSVFYNAMQIAKTAMIVRKKVKQQALIDLSIGIVNFILSCFFSYFWGEVGACLSIFVAYTLRTILQSVVLHKVLKIDILYFIRNCYLQMLPAALASLLSSFLICRFIPFDGWMGVFLKGIIVVAVFIVVFLLIGMTPEEKQKVWRKRRTETENETELKS